MVNTDVPLLVCVSADVDVRERVVRRLGDCGAVLICADLDELRAMLFPAGAAPEAAPTAMLAAAPGAAAPGAAAPGAAAPEGTAIGGTAPGATVPGTGPGAGLPGTGSTGLGAGGAAGIGSSGNGSHGATGSSVAVAQHDGVVTIGELTIDPAAHLVIWRGQPLPLTRLERELLGRLATPPVSVWTYQRLFDVVWGKAYLGDTSILHSAVKRLRGKLRAAGDGLCVETVRGVGYRLAVLR